MTDVEAELRQQFRDAFAGADFPVTSPTDLLPLLPDGPGTTFEAGDVRFTAMELGTSVSSEADFPYEDVDALVDDLVAALHAKDMLE